MTFQEFDDRIRTLLEKHSQWEMERCPDDVITMRLRGDLCDHMLKVSLPALYEEQEKIGCERTEKGLEEELHAAESVQRRHRSLNYPYYLDEKRGELFERLRKKRSEFARDRHVAPYVVFSNRTLYEMCMEMPEDAEEMRKLYGVGEVNFARYGEEFLRIIREFGKEVDTKYDTTYTVGERYVEMG